MLKNPRYFYHQTKAINVIAQPLTALILVRYIPREGLSGLDNALAIPWAAATLKVIDTKTKNINQNTPRPCQTHGNLNDHRATSKSVGTATTPHHCRGALW